MSAPPRFLSAPPEVRLTGAFAGAFDNAVAAARTCYSPKGIVRPEEVAGWARRDDLARSLYHGGHHTVFQHAHFQFALANVSRQFVWTFLHGHPFYNSEQVSQRYVEVKADTCAVPPLEGRALDVYRETTGRLFEAYRDLTAALEGAVAAEYFARFKGRAKDPQEKKTRDAIKKRCMEAARYVLPIGTFTCLYHTVSGITLMRYHRLCRQMDAPSEQALVVGAMVEELLRAAPEYRAVLEETLPLEETPEHRFFQEAAHPADARAQEQFVHEFDVDLEGRVSLLVDHKVNNEKLLADSVREVLGVPRTDLGDDDAIALALDPARNRLLAESMNVTSLSKVTRALFHPSWTFRKKLSHTADSQDQRHRMTPGSRPCLAAYLTRDPDYVTPAVVRSDAKARALFERAMARAWEGIAAMRKAGAPDEFAAYALPNAVSIRFTESADLMGLRHKCAMRLCYNAQEEIWRAAVDEARQVREVNPRIGKYLLPPCGLRDRAGQRPTCPEGERYCGVPVWRMGLDDYARVI
jgi:thymidylate synthase ThyX